MTETSSSLAKLSAHAQHVIRHADSLALLDALRVQYLGKKGEVTTQLKQLGKLDVEQRKTHGAQLNQLKNTIQGLLEDRQQELSAIAVEMQLKKEQIDVTQPARGHGSGALHPVTRTLQRMEAIFDRVGFDIVTGPEIEDEYYNFEALNIPENHPARAMHDTFYLGQKTVLRTHTSPVQIRHMHTNQPPIKVIAPGRVYRCDSDVTHAPMFHQLEGLVIDRDISFADLKGILIYFIREFFEVDLGVRFRPSYFPFTEPSAEVDIACIFCNRGGCRICKGSGWIEVLGSGMVHPKVLGHGGIDHQEYGGYAFGLGVERLTMLRYGIDDLRLFFESNLNFLRQF